MCGINGIVGLESITRAAAVIAQMNAALAHRGPNDSGTFVEAGVALSQRRLSIIDLSAAGHQPMLSEDGNLVLVFNGEIYNYRALKQELQDFPFRTQTDTEVILAAYVRWGKACVHHFNGMFAFALYDKSKGEVFIARDRLGIKPLYYYRHEGLLLFSSEVRALLKSGLVPRKLNRTGLVDYLRYQTVHAPATMVQDVHMLLPGHTMVLKAGQCTISRYWSQEADYSQAAASQSYAEVKAEVHRLLQQAVERRLVADVPFGAFLSGGIDSSIIVGLMRRVAAHRVKTFAVTFDEEAFSEAKYAAMIARKFDTDHTEIRLKPNDFLALIPEALQAMDHPSGDGPNTFLVSKVTKTAGITMALSGLGGDEVFAGYDVFKRMTALQQYGWVAALPPFARKAAGGALMALKPSVASQKIKELLALPSWQLAQTYPITRQVLPDEFIKTLTGTPGLPPNAVQEIVQHSRQAMGGGVLPLLSQVSVAEMKTYMQNTLLRDTDQMSMAHALEVRVPFLDHELVEYVLGVPDKYKYPATPKKLLTDAVGDLLPPEIINRPKMGFVLPWQAWLKNELYAFADAKISSLGRRGILHEAALQQLWQGFLRGDAGITWSRVWYLIVLEDWLEQHGIEA